MPSILENLDDLDRMVDANAGKSDVRFQIDLISKQVAAFEADYENLATQHADLEEEHAKLKKAHSELDAAKAKPTAQTPGHQATELENIQKNILLFLFQKGDKTTAAQVGAQFHLEEQAALYHLEDLERIGLVNREVIGGSHAFPEPRNKIFPDTWLLSAEGRRWIMNQQKRANDWGRVQIDPDYGGGSIPNIL